MLLGSVPVRASLSARRAAVVTALVLLSLLLVSRGSALPHRYRHPALRTLAPSHTTAADFFADASFGADGPLDHRDRALVEADVEAGVGVAGGWSDVLVVCDGRCGFGMLAQLWEELHTSDPTQLSPWVGPGQQHLKAQAANRVAKMNNANRQKDSRDMAAAASVSSGMGVSSAAPGAGRPTDVAEQKRLVDIARNLALAAEGLPTQSEVKARTLIVKKKHWVTTYEMPGFDKLSQPEAEPRFTYAYGQRSQLLSARGFVRQGKGTDADDKGMCVALWQVAFVPGGAGPDTEPVVPRHVPLHKGRSLELGHIVASSLGGSNKQLINFMPQTQVSNHGVYNKAEEFAAMMRDYYNKLNKGVHADCVWIDIRFSYDSSAAATWRDRLLPIGGTYTVSWNLVCAGVQPPPPADIVIPPDVNPKCVYTATWKNHLGSVIKKADKDNPPAWAGPDAKEDAFDISPNYRNQPCKQLADKLLSDKNEAVKKAVKAGKDAPAKEKQPKPERRKQRLQREAAAAAAAAQSDSSPSPAAAAATPTATPSTDGSKNKGNNGSRSSASSGSSIPKQSEAPNPMSIHALSAVGGGDNSHLARPSAVASTPPSPRLLTSAPMGQSTSSRPAAAPSASSPTRVSSAVAPLPAAAPAPRSPSAPRSPAGTQPGSPRGLSSSSSSASPKGPAAKL